MGLNKPRPSLELERSLKMTPFDTLYMTSYQVVISIALFGTIFEVFNSPCEFVHDLYITEIY